MNAMVTSSADLGEAWSRVSDEAALAIHQSESDLKAIRDNPDSGLDPERPFRVLYERVGVAEGSSLRRIHEQDRFMEVAGPWREFDKATSSLSKGLNELQGRQLLQDAFRIALTDPNRAIATANAAKELPVDWEDGETTPDDLIAGLAPPAVLPPRPTSLDTALDRQATLQEATSAFLEFRSRLMGNPVRAWAADLASPSQEQVASWVQSNVANWLPALTGQATTLAVDIAIGLLIMLVATFYFLADGPALIRSAMKLSPLDDNYERELIEEFDSISRAVVVATLLSAVAQGLLAGNWILFRGR